MRVLSRLSRKGLSWSSIGQTFDQGPFWARTPLWVPSSLDDREQIEANFESYVQHAYKRNGIVFACVLTRQLIFSEARFQYRRFSKGRPANMFGDESLSILERPWPNGTTGELLASMEHDLSLAGNWFGTTVGSGADRRIRRLRPDWVTIVTGSPSDDPFDIEARPVGYIYEPKASTARVSKPVLLTTDQVVHYSFPPDPEAQWRGMSWITPVVREIEADSAATTHKWKFFQNGATTNFVVTYDANLTKPQFDQFVEAFNLSHRGVDNAYKTIHLGGGADVKTVGADLKQLDFKLTQGAGETRVAAASGVGAIVAQFSEGMQGASLNAGNYAAARRRAADALFRPMWRIAAASLEKFTTPPPGAHLWYDDRDIAFLREDAKDAAEIQRIKASTIRQLVDGGYVPSSAVAAVDAQDMTLLVHTGLTSVQLLPPRTTAEQPTGADSDAA